MMKRWIKSSTAAGVDRICIDFYGDIDLEEIIGGKTVKKHHVQRKQPKRLFKNTQVVIRDVTNYLKSKGLTVLRTEKSSNYNSDSTYYDVDIQYQTADSDVEYIYLRISDHPEDSSMTDARDSYHDDITRNYGDYSESEDVRNKWSYESIEVDKIKKYKNYNLAMNYVKQRIDGVLERVGIQC